MNFALLSIYRRKNSDTVARLALQAASMGGSTSLWALDEVEPSLSTLTQGAGPGGRFELLNRLIEGLGPETPLVVADDDVTMSDQSFRRFIWIAKRYGLQLAQPSHGLTSANSYRFCRRRPWLAVRRTTFVEIGPLFWVSSIGRDTFTPFPTITKMGWGVDLLWRDHALNGVPMGIVDAAPMKHLNAVGSSSYNMETEGAYVRELLAERGLEHLGLAQQTIARFGLASLVLGRRGPEF